MSETKKFILLKDQYVSTKRKSGEKTENLFRGSLWTLRFEEKHYVCNEDPSKRIRYMRYLKNLSDLEFNLLEDIPNKHERWKLLEERNKILEEAISIFKIMKSEKLKNLRVSIKVREDSKELKEGTLKSVGKVNGLNGLWFGVELDEPVQNLDYPQPIESFEGKPGCCVMITVDKIINFINLPLVSVFQSSVLLKNNRERSSSESEYSSNIPKAKKSKEKKIAKNESNVRKMKNQLDNTSNLTKTATNFICEKDSFFDVDSDSSDNKFPARSRCPTDANLLSKPKPKINPTRLRHPSAPPIFLDNVFFEGSMVQVKIPGMKEMQYGVVRWMAVVQGEIIYGLELEKSCVAATDGRLGNHKAFDCPPRRGYFSKASKVSADTRFQFSDKKKDEETLVSCLVAEKDFFLLQKLSSFKNMFEIAPPISHDSFNLGIQGNHNSCYMDVVLFCMFAFNHSFDYMFKDPPPPGHTQQLLLFFLKKEIVNPLRKKAFVSGQKMMDLRRKLESFGGFKGFQTECKDCEEFIDVFFNKLLQLEPFHNFNDKRNSFLVQLFLNGTLEKTLHSSLSNLSSEMNLIKSPSKLNPFQFDYSSGRGSGSVIVPISSDGSSLPSSPTFSFLPSSPSSVSTDLKLTKNAKENISPHSLSSTSFFFPSSYSVQHLFDISLSKFDLKFSKVPQNLLLQMPRLDSEGISTRIFPTFFLDITPYIQENVEVCQLCKGVSSFSCFQCKQEFNVSRPVIFYCEKCLFITHETEERKNHHPVKISKTNIIRSPVIMELHSLICIKTSHYISFSKCHPNPSAPWVFFDSMADRIESEIESFNIPKLKLVKELKTLVQIENEKKNCDLSNYAFSDYLERFINDAYICFYRKVEEEEEEKKEEEEEEVEKNEKINFKDMKNVLNRLKLNNEEISEESS